MIDSNPNTVKTLKTTNTKKPQGKKAEGGDSGGENKRTTRSKMVTISDIQTLLKQNRDEYADILQKGVKSLSTDMSKLRKDMQESFRRLDEDITKNKKDIEDCKTQLSQLKMDPSGKDNSIELNWRLKSKLRFQIEFTS